MNFIHTADIHLGAAPDSTMTWATDRGTEIWDSFYKLLDETERSGADLLLIAGDLFHRQPLKRELKELNYRFSQLTHAKVVIVAGNHDYIGNQSFYKDFEWADNVVFFRKNHISYVYIQSLNLIVYGMSYDRQEITEAMYDSLKPMRRFRDGRPLPDGCRHILLAHGGDSSHIPINQEKLRQAGFDYIALGLFTNRGLMIGVRWLMPVHWNRSTAMMKDLMGIFAVFSMKVRQRSILFLLRPGLISH
ncbi:MAG: metallophosphoesterase family protein [Coprococcus sp.]